MGVDSGLQVIIVRGSLSRKEIKSLVESFYPPFLWLRVYLPISDPMKGVGAMAYY